MASEPEKGTNDSLHLKWNAGRYKELRERIKSANEALRADPEGQKAIGDLGNDILRLLEKTDLDSTQVSKLIEVDEFYLAFAIAGLLTTAELEFEEFIVKVANYLLQRLREHSIIFSDARLKRQYPELAKYTNL